MKLTTDEQERLENIIDIIWQIAGCGCIFILCFFFWMLDVAYGG